MATFRSEADAARKRVLSRRAKDLKKFHPGHKSIKKVEKQLADIEAKEKAKTIERNKVSGRVADPKTTSSRPRVVDNAERFAREQESRPVWNPQEQMAKRYYDCNPNVQSEQYFSSVKDDKGEVKGYTDRLNKQSVALGSDETITDDALENANKQATALVNIGKDKEKASKKSVVADKEKAITSVYVDDKKIVGTYTASPKQGFQAGLTTGLMKFGQRSRASSSPLAKVAGLTGAFVGAGAKAILIDLPMVAVLVTKSLIYDVPRANIAANIAALKMGPGEAKQKFKSNVDAIPLVVVAGVSKFVDDVVQKAKYSPEVLAGEVTGSIIAPTVLTKIVAGVSKVGTTILAKVGLKYRDPTTVFSPTSLASSGKLPTTKSTAETVAAFKSSARNLDKFDDINVLNVIDDVADDVVLGGYSYKDSGISPNTGKPSTSKGFYGKGFKEKPLTSSVYSEVIPDEELVAAHITTAEFGKSGSFRSGPAGEAGVQDSGLFVSSGGHLSPLRIDGSTSSTEYSFNPLKWLESFKGSGTSKGYEIAFKNLETLPDEVLNQPGFSGVKTYHATRVGDETAFISKRSTIGHGEIQPKIYTAADDFVLKDKTTKAGTKLLEKGTVEEEAIFPENTLYEFGAARSNIAKKLLKAEEYTYYNGKMILLTGGKVAKGSGLVDDAVSGVNLVTGVTRSPVDESVSPSVEILTSKDIISSSRNVNTNIVYVDPVSSGAGLIGSVFGVGAGKVNIIVGSSNVVSSKPSSSGSPAGYSVSSSSSYVNLAGGVSPVVSKKSKPVSPSIISSSGSGRSPIDYSVSPSSSSSSGSGRSGSSGSSSSSSRSGLSTPTTESTPTTSPSSSIVSSPVSVSPSSSIVSSPVSGYPGSSITSSTSSTSSGYSNFGKSSKRSFGGLFSAQVRKSGRWVTVDPGFGFSESEALNKGLSVVGTSARASTRIIKASAGAKKKRFYGIGILGNFYKKGNVFIEKRGKRIKSRGELEEITYKGQRARKSKSIMGKMGLFK